MQILPKTNPSETKVTNTGVSKPPQIGGSTVSRSRGLENNFFYFRNHFLKIHTWGIPKMSDFYVFSHFWPRKWLLKLKKRVLTPSFSHLTFSSQMGTLSRWPREMQWDKSERNTSEKSDFSNLPKLEGEPPQIGGSAISRSRALEN